MAGGGGIGGGISSILAGGEFSDGLQQGLITSMANHAVHGAFQGGPGDLPWDLDGDGRLSLKEGNWWFRNGDGQAITVDAQTVDLDFLNPEDWFVGQYERVQTLVKSRTGRIYGNIDLTYQGNNQFVISPDPYHFPHAPGSGAFRNFANWIGKINAGKGTKYIINFKGINTVNYSPFKPNFPTGYKGF